MPETKAGATTAAPIEAQPSPDPLHGYDLFLGYLSGKKIDYSAKVSDDAGKVLGEFSLTLHVSEGLGTEVKTLMRKAFEHFNGVLTAKPAAPAVAGATLDEH